MQLLRALLFQVSLCAPLAVAGELKFDQTNDTAPPVPAGASLSLSLPEKAMIGEMVSGKLIVRNTGSEAFEISTGGDYRGSPVPHRLKVRVTDASGKVLPDLTQHQTNMGGMMGSRKIEPGKEESLEFSLNGYATVLAPGLYTVEASHDLGWKVQAAMPHPTASARIEFRLPDAAEAAARVKLLCSDNKEDQEWPLSCLQHSLYLAPLLEEARRGNAAAVTGIGGIASVSANQALLELMKTGTQEVAQRAARSMVPRLPSLADPTKPAFPGRDPRTTLMACWEEKLDPELLAAARQLLETKDEVRGGLGADLIAARGGTDQAPAIMKALQEAMEIYRSPRHGPGANVLDPPGALRQLIGAVDALRARGWRVEYGGGGTAVLLAQFRQYADKSIPRPDDEGWILRSLTWIDNGPAVLQENALQALPLLATQPWEKPVTAALNSADWGVVRHACEAVGRSGRKDFIRPLSQIIETIPESFVQHSAHLAAVNLGARVELWEAWCEVITEPGRMVDALSFLCRGTLEVPALGGGSGNSNFTREERFIIRDAWRVFLARNRALLMEGKRLPLDDPSIVPAMTGSGFRKDAAAVRISLPDGKEWPARQ